jgi:hypothetical protein
MPDAIPFKRNPGRPPLPQEHHRRQVTIRLSPALFAELTAAAEAAGHSLSREIEDRCQTQEAVKLLVRAGEDAKPGTWGSLIRTIRKIRSLAQGHDIDIMVRLPADPHPTNNDGDPQ